MQKYTTIIASTILVLLSTTSAYAQQMNLALAPNASKVITNHYGWTLNANCIIKNKEQNKIRVSILDHKGAVNGRNLDVGQTMSVVVHNHDNIAVSAEPGTKITLENLSADMVQATCST